MRRVYVYIVLVFIFCSSLAIREAVAQARLVRMYQLCTVYGEQHVPGWAAAELSGEPPLVSADRGDHRDGVCGGYLNGTRVFTLRCWEGVCRPL